MPNRHALTTTRRHAWLLVGLVLCWSIESCRADQYLGVSTPDVITPGSAGSAAGAEALRVGAIAQLSTTTTGSGLLENLNEGPWFLGGLLTDEYRGGDTQQERTQVDQRSIQLSNSVLDGAWRLVNGARIAASQAIAAERQYSPTLTANLAQMYWIRGFAELIIAENFCNGAPISTVDLNGNIVFGVPESNAATYARALASFDSAIANGTNFSGSTRGDTIKLLAAVSRGRDLLDQGKFSEAAAAVAAVPDNFRFLMNHSDATIDNWIWFVNNSGRRFVIGEHDGIVGMNFASANDPRVPVCIGGSVTCAANGVTGNTSQDGSFGPAGIGGPLYIQLIWPSGASAASIVSGLEARLIEAEASLHAGDVPTWLTKLNALRAAFQTLKQPSNTTTAGSSLAPLSDPGTPDARIDLMFQERALWLFGTGHRLADLRRLVRPSSAGGYGRTEASVFPTGAFFRGGSFGSDKNLPIPLSELNNPNFQSCADRSP